MTIQEECITNQPWFESLNPSKLTKKYESLKFPVLQTFLPTPLCPKPLFLPKG